jgi:AmmeMemoRadiSam system protein B/AmmeMemoRadiSam system protein A
MRWALAGGGLVVLSGMVLGALYLAAAAMPAPTPSSAPREGRAKSVRPPVLAGTWYEGSPTALARQVDGLLSSAPAADLPPGRPAFLIQPHAGYVYSGKAAATGLKAIQRSQPDRVIILAPSHRAAFRGACVPDVTHFATPLGEVALDTEVCAALTKTPDVRLNTAAHAQEHSIEIQLPLLQRVFGTEKWGQTPFSGAMAAPFRIVPLLLGQCSERDLDGIAVAVRPHLGPRTLVIASSDFTHYGRDFDYVPFTGDVAANLAKLDGGAVKHILDRSAPAFEKYVAETGATICGHFPIGVLLRLLPADAVGRQLVYYTSGDVTGSWSSSVSYVSLVFCVPEQAAAGGLSKAEQQALLKLARATLVKVLKEGKAPTAQEVGIELTPALKESCGVFVTLKNRDELRGCIGYIVGRAPLYQAVIENTVNAATRDYRFASHPVTADEAPRIHIEISVMSPLQRITDPNAVEVGKHGVYLEKGGNAGVFLPQVATEQGWNRQQYLEQLGRKAGLDREAWKTARLSVFTAQVFGEE